MHTKSRDLSVLVAAYILTSSTIATAAVIPAGNGSYTTQKPAHRWQPSTAEGYDQTVPEGQPWGIHFPRQNQTPSVSQRFAASGKATPTHDFWASVVWEFAVENKIRTYDGSVVLTDTSMVPYSHWMTNSPFTMKFTKRGVNLTYAKNALLVPYRYEDPTTNKPVIPSVTDPKFSAYTFPARITPNGDTEFNVQFEGLEASETVLDDYSDFAATILLNKPGTSEASDFVKTTMVNGSPFLHFEKNGLGNVRFTHFNGMRLLHESDGTLAVYLTDTRVGYSIFAPKGSTFTYTLANEDLKELAPNGHITLTLPSGASRFSVAILPDEINDIFKAPTAYNADGLSVTAGATVSSLPTHIAGTDRAVNLAPLLREFFREDTAGVAQLDNLILDYRKHAFAIPQDSQFSYNYDESNALVTSNFTLQTQLAYNEAGLQNTSLMGLFRHQYVNINEPLNYRYTYTTPRGEMKVITGNTFRTQYNHIGLLPNLPNTLEGAELTKLLELLGRDENGQFADGLVRNDVMDTYTNGKELNWILQVLHIAEQVGNTSAANMMIDILKEHVEDWLSADDWQEDQLYDNSNCHPMAEPGRSDCYRNYRLQHEKKYFYYNEDWNSLTGFPASYGSDTELNDHHFHAGYIISAAAAIARYDSQWSAGWKPMVDLLIKDSANWDRNDSDFQYLRYFDIYNGFSVANGHLNMDAGGNQESSSESINFAQAVALWGSETGDQAIRDLGIFLYTSEIQAIHQYWFDVDDAVFPKDVFWYDGGKYVQEDFDRPNVGMVWHSKADFGTWFGAAPRMIAGINFLPITGASLHLGHMVRGQTPSIQMIMDRLDGDTRLFAEDFWHRDLPEEYTQYDFRRKTKFWDDLMWQAQALVNPNAAAQKFAAAGDYKSEIDPEFSPMYPNDEVRAEAGASKTHTYHWIYNLKNLGTPVRGVTANTAHYAVFEKNGQRTHVAYNPSSSPITVSFSDNTVIVVPAGELSGGSNTPVPPAVTGVNTSNITRNSATVSWTPMTGEWSGARYRVRVSANNQDVFNQETGNGQISLQNLAASTSYSVRITTVANGLEGRSATVSFTTAIDPASVPAVANLRLTAATLNSVNVAWNAIPSQYTGADYRVQLLQGSQVVSTLNSTQGATQASFTSLQENTSYTVIVFARSNNNESPAASLAVATETTAPVQGCDATSEMYCVEEDGNTAVITFNPQANWAIAHVTAPPQGQTGGFQMVKAGNVFTHSVTGLSNGNVVTFTFTYFDTVGRDVGPFTYTFGSASTGGEAAIVSGLSVGGIQTTGATINWLAVQGSNVTYRVAVTRNGSAVLNETVSATSLPISGQLQADTTYLVEVTPIVGTKVGAARNISFKTLAANATTTPTPTPVGNTPTVTPTPPSPPTPVVSPTASPNVTPTVTPTATPAITPTPGPGSTPTPTPVVDNPPPTEIRIKKGGGSTSWFLLSLLVLAGFGRVGTALSRTGFSRIN